MSSDMRRRGGGGGDPFHHPHVDQLCLSAKYYSLIQLKVSLKYENQPLMRCLKLNSSSIHFHSMKYVTDRTDGREVYLYRRLLAAAATASMWAVIAIPIWFADSSDDCSRDRRGARTERI